MGEEGKKDYLSQARARLKKRLKECKAARAKRKVKPPTSFFEEGVTMSLCNLQNELRVWTNHNFPARDWTQPFMGIVEEVGELSHALLKQRQGIRGTWEDHEAAAKDAVGDILVFVADLCNARGWNMEEILAETWAEVKKRQWR